MNLTLKHAVAAMILVLCFAAPMAAGPLEDADAALKKRDYATAIQLLRPLADQGVTFAQYNLGVIYANGQGVPQNYAQALKWYRLAADRGHTLAQYNLGFMHANGQGVPQNDTEAVKWYRLAADRGHAPAQSNLGLMYAQGLGAPRNYVRAQMWFNLSAAQGNQIAVQNRDHIALILTPAQIAEAQKLAREWKPIITQPPR